MRGFLLLAVLAFATAERTRYDGFKVYNVICNTPEQWNLIKEMENLANVDVWHYSAKLGGKSHVMVSPQRDYWFTQSLVKHGIEYSVHIDDVQPLIDENYRELKADFDLNEYNDLETIYAEMDIMAVDCEALDDSLECTTRVVGQSHEGRDMKALYIGKEDEGRAGIWLDCGIHSREWIAVSSCVNFMDRMARYYGTDAEVTDMVDKFNWYIVPVVNPDGYDYTHIADGDRLWRKNRNPNYESTSNCYGVDLNRNFDYDWNTVGSSEVACSQTYHGPSAASEIETQVIQQTSQDLRARENVIGWVTAHTYGEMWMHSYGGADGTGPGSSCKRSEDHDDLFRVAEESVQAIEAVYNEATWIYGSICETIYEAAGNTVDYIHGTSLVKYVYTPELRGNGFVAPTSEIEPAFNELWAGMRQMVRTSFDIEFPDGLPSKK